MQKIGSGAEVISVFQSVKGPDFLVGPAQIQFLLGIDARTGAAHSGSFLTAQSFLAGPFHPPAGEGSGLLGGPAQIQFWLGIDAGIDASHSGSFPTGHTEKAGPFTLFTRNAPQAT